MTLLSSYPGNYPRRLATQFPHVADTLGLLWGEAGIQRYFDRLILSDRIDRHGFPPEVMGELIALREIHDSLFPRLAQTTDVWSYGPDR